MKNKISIVIPVHNKEPYLGHTLESVLFQTHDEFELILIDDGSTDNSGLICDQYALMDLRIKVIHQKNAGVSAARNVGIRASQFSLIAFIDADDYWDRTYLEQMNELITNYPQVSIYSSKFASIVNGVIQPMELPFKCSNEFVCFDLIDKCCDKARFPIHTSSVILRKNAIEKIGYFDERIYVFEDYDLFLRVGIFSDIAYLNRKPLTFYNTDIPPETKMRGRFPLLEKDWISYMDKYDIWLDQNKKLKLFLDRSKLSQLIGYRRSKLYKDKVKNILSSVEISNYGWKNRIIFMLPPFMSTKLIKAYSITIPIFRSIRNIFSFV